MKRTGNIALLIVFLTLLALTGCSLMPPAPGQNETAGSAPEGFVRLRSGIVTENIGNSVFKTASTDNVSINAFYLAEAELSYARWHEVYVWATDPARGENKYEFANQGIQGNLGTAGAEPSEGNMEPVTNISWRDAIVWCNAASEMDGRTPVYYLEDTTEFVTDNVLRVSETDKQARAGTGKADFAVADPNANGYRLPTSTEWEYAFRGGVPGSTEWSYLYYGTNDKEALNDYAVISSTQTANVKTKRPNSAGLYDMGGNVWEYCDSFSTANYRVLYSGGDFSHDSAYCVADRPWSAEISAASNTVGFRLACNVID